MYREQAVLCHVLILYTHVAAIDFISGAVTVSEKVGVVTLMVTNSGSVIGTVSKCEVLRILRHKRNNIETP